MALERFWLRVGFTDRRGRERGAGPQRRSGHRRRTRGSTGRARIAEKLHVPVLSYRAAREDLELNDALMLRLGADTHVLPDVGHLDSFNRSDDVLEFAMPFLRQHAHVA